MFTILNLILENKNNISYIVKYQFVGRLGINEEDSCDICVLMSLNL
jgi:hypothetical protein